MNVELSVEQQTVKATEFSLEALNENSALKAV